MSILSALILCALMGGVGQGIRAVLGLKNAGLTGNGTPTQQTSFNAAYFVVSMMVGLIAGVLAGIGIGLDKVMIIQGSDPKLLLAIVAAGYAGADFIENAVGNLIPNLGQPIPTTTTTPPPTNITPPAGPAPVTPPSPFPNLAPALTTVSPHLNTTLWTPLLLAGFVKYDVNSNRRAAGAIGQFLVEAGPNFTELEEDLTYTHADRLVAVFPDEFPTADAAAPYVGKPVDLANKVYAGKNGNTQPGDGYLFRGRGLIQLTGRSEYTEFATSVNMTPEQAADYCKTPAGAAMSGCWYLAKNGCLTLADSKSWSDITRKVNGAAMQGNSQRMAYSDAMLKALGGT